MRLSVYLSVIMCACPRADAPEVSLKLLVNDNVQKEDDNGNVVIKEHDSVLFICSSVASPHAHAWRSVYQSVRVKTQDKFAVRSSRRLVYSDCKFSYQFSFPFFDYSKVIRAGSYRASD